MRKVTFPNTSFIDYGYDNVARMASTILKKNDSTVLNSHSYLYDPRNSRTRQTRTDASYVDYAYDNLGQLDTALGTGGQSTENLDYNYDAAWNMTARSTATYTVNSLNQVTGDGANTYTYDANGNRTYKSYSNGYVEYFYDDENQLIRVQDTTNPYPTYWWKTEFVYDGRMRLRIRKEYTWDTMYSQWSLSSETRYVYDGMRVIQERNSSNTPAVTYTRGLDLGLSLEGAGGIGGLLARSSGYSGSTGNWSTHVFYHADGNGNVTFLVKSDQTMGAQYRYDPFGRTTSITGTFAGANVYRFSSKEWHSQTGLYYYGYRFYDPNVQRWLNRDPIGESGGLNLYSIVANAPQGAIDPFGLSAEQKAVENLCRARDDLKSLEHGVEILRERMKDAPKTELPHLLSQWRRLNALIPKYREYLGQAQAAYAAAATAACSASALRARLVSIGGRVGLVGAAGAGGYICGSGVEEYVNGGMQDIFEFYWDIWYK